MKCPQRRPKTSRKGKSCYTDSSGKAIYLLPGEPVPEGFEKRGPKQPSGYIYCNNGASEMRVVSIADIPDGYAAGRLSNSKHATTTGKTFYTNGDIDIALALGEAVPEGFHKGSKRKGTIHKRIVHCGEENVWIDRNADLPAGFSEGRFSSPVAGLVMYTDGEKMIRLNPDDEPPDGFYRGAPYRAYSDSELKTFLEGVDSTELECNLNEHGWQWCSSYYNRCEQLIRAAADELQLHVALCRSNPEKEIADFVRSLTGSIETNVRNVVPGYELDIWLPDNKLAIEFNGTYWHSSIWKPKSYHFDKSKAAEAAGIRLIHVWEYEWASQRQQIESLIRIAICTPSKIFARQCSIRQISNKEAKPFNEKNHLQGHRGAQVTYGLFYKGELVQLMSFSKTKWNRNLKGSNDWEIIRGCPGSNNIVVGGVSRLLKHFINDYAPDKIFSYCDFNKFDGRSYEAAGMAFAGYTGPDKKWWLKDGTVANRSPRRYKELKESAQAELWGAGSKKYEMLITH